MLKYGSFSLLLIFFIPLHHVAQSVFPHLKTYTSAEGLSLNNVNNVYPDTYGFLWVATEHGLNRFDGNNFTRFYASFNPPNGLAGSTVSKVVCDSIMIWLAIKGRGLATFFDMAHYFISFTHSDDDSESLASNNVRCMFLSGKKILYVGTDNGMSILVKESNRFKNILKHPGTHQSLDVTAITEDRQGIIWLGTSNGNILFINERNEPVVLNNLPDAIRQSAVNDMLFDKQTGDLLLATSKGAWRVKLNNENRVSLTTSLYGLDNIEISCIRSNGRGDIWIGTRFDGIYLKETGNNLLHYTTHASDNLVGLVSNEIKDINFTTDGSVWISTPEGLQSWHKSRQRFHFYAISDKLHNEKPGSLLMVNRTLLASLDGGIWSNESQSIFPRAANIKIDHFKQYDNEHYACTDNGIFEVSETPDLVRPAHLNHFTELIANAADIEKIDQWRYWIAVNDGNVYSIDKRSDSAQKIFTSQNGYPRFFTGKKNLFLFLHDSIRVFEKGVPVRTVPHALRNVTIHDLFDDGKNIWIAAQSDGLYKCDSALRVIKKFTLSDGLSEDNIFTITGINNQLWLTTSRGLNMFDIATEKFRSFFEADGLRSHEFRKNGRYLSEEGTLYLSTEKGIIAFNPKEWTFPARSDAKIFISKVVIGRMQLDRYELAAMNTDFRLTADYGTSITFSFAAGINYNTSDQPLMYSVSGTTWSTIKSGSDIRLDELRPGRHILFVMQPENDQFNEKTIEIWIDIIPAWYQRSEFFVVVFLLLSAAVYLFYRYRVRELKKLHAVRTKISQDLHDEVGATLSGISMYSHLTREQIKSGAVGEIDKSLGVIQHAATEMVNKLNDIVWVVNPKK